MNTAAFPSRNEDFPENLLIVADQWRSTLAADSYVNHMFALTLTIVHASSISFLELTAKEKT